MDPFERTHRCNYRVQLMCPWDSMLVNEAVQLVSPCPVLYYRLSMRVRLGAPSWIVSIYHYKLMSDSSNLVFLYFSRSVLYRFFYVRHAFFCKSHGMSNCTTNLLWVGQTCCKIRADLCAHQGIGGGTTFILWGHTEMYNNIESCDPCHVTYEL